jgi:hypothetical protein
MDTIPPEALLADQPPERRAIANSLRDLVKRAVPEAIERVRPGWGLIGYDVPVERGKTRYFAFVWAEPEHVHLGFEHGVLMDDPAHLLQGRGETKQVRWLTFQRLDEIPPETEELVREAVRVATLSRGEKAFIRMEREDAAPGG